MKNAKNARFWVFVNESQVKLTLRPGQTLTHVQAGLTDEGWFRRVESWEHQGDRIENVIEEDARDCDGRFWHCETYQCLLGLLSSYRNDYYDQMGWHNQPHWTKCRGRQRDYSAEAAGY